MSVVQFVLMYIFASVLLSAGWVTLSVHLGWPWWAAVLGVVGVFIGVVVKFTWDLGRVSGGWS